MYALNARSGALLWKYDTEGLVSSSPAIVDGRVYIGSGHPGVFCLNADNGALIWKFTTAKSVVASPLVADGLVFFGDYDGWFYALDLNGELVWKTRCQKKIDASAAYLDGVVYWVDMTGTLFAARGATGEPVWQFPLQGPAISSPLLDERYLYAVRYRPALLFMLDRLTGELLWSFALDGNAYASPMIYRNRLFIGTEKGSLYAFKSAEEDSLLTEVHP
ncbi:MAG: PQQ-like beta-propeller repeat protein [candidate division KSB1 bacterium]|nr:PQQ-like beta-propeller repeat protein [candidate division KSB1 bacterium]